MAEREITNIDLLVARHALGSLMADTEYSEEIAAKVLESLDNAARHQPVIVSSNYTRTRAIAVFSRLLESEQIDPDAAQETIDRLSLVMGGLPPTSDKEVVLKTPIAEVARYARLEMEEVIEFERGIGDVAKRTDLTSLERAVYNLQTINGWVDKTWLQQFLQRKDKDIVLHRSKANIAYNVALLPYIFDKVNRIGRVYKSRGPYALTLSHEGIVMGAGYPLSADDLENNWDNGKTWTVDTLSLIDRTEKAEKIHKEINV